MCKEVVSVKRKAEGKLLDWKAEPNRKPLLLSGARQVGKTYLLRQFAREHYPSTAYFNLEAEPAIAALFEEDLDPARLIRYMEISAGQRILPGETLLILDEIQSCERALTSLKYFCEEAPEYHVAAAGSLLGVAVNRERYSFPVGKVDLMTLYPMDFEEYLWAGGKELLAEAIRSAFQSMEPFPESLHTEAVSLYREYLLVGGMPAAVTAFTAHGSFLDAREQQTAILNNYVADMAKYASASESVRIRACFASIPAQLAKENHKFQYKVVRRGGSAAMFGASIEWLELAGLVNRCWRLEQPVHPVAVYRDPSAFKLYMGDVGLLSAQTGISAENVLNAQGDFIGALTENYVAQQLTAAGRTLCYWESGGIAEVDFILENGAAVVPLEVKRGEHVRSRSLNVYREKYHPPVSVRLSLRNFGESDGIRSVPLYAAFCL